MTLTRFIDGLSDELSFNVRSYRPESLEEAYEITVQYSNAAYRQKLNKKSTQDRGNSREKEYDTPHQPVDSVLESDDDEY